MHIAELSLMPRPATARVHGAVGTLSLHGSGPRGHSSAEALDFAALSIPQQSGTSP